MPARALKGAPRSTEQNPKFRTARSRLPAPRSAVHPTPSCDGRKRSSGAHWRREKAAASVRCAIAAAGGGAAAAAVGRAFAAAGDHAVAVGARQRLQWQVRAGRLSWAAGWAEDHQIECAAVRGDRRERRGCRAPRRPRWTNTSPVAVEADVVGGPGALQRTPVHAASCQPRQSSRCHASRKAASAQCVSYH